MAKIRKKGFWETLNRNAIIIIILIVWVLIGFLSKGSVNSQKSATNDGGYTIDEYNVILDVKSNNIIDVTEKITVDWYEYGHKGIIKFIPTWLEYTGTNGKTIKRKSNIYSLRAVDEKYSVDEVKKDKKRIKIGDPYETVGIGLHTYIIKYSYDMGEDPFKNFDEFIFHTYGDFWGTRINNASLQINLPKNFDANNIKFFADKYRKEDITQYVDYEVIGNTIYAKLSDNYKLDKSLTVDIELPEGYFVGKNNNYGKNSFIISVVIIVGTIISFILWLKFGKNYAKEPRTVEFYSPENLDAAQVGYIYGKQTGKKLTIALIIQLASKGYIRIEESEDKKSQTIYNLNLSNEQLEKMKSKKERVIKVKRIKDIDNALTREEKAWMKELFDKEDYKEIRAGFGMFYDESKSLIENRYLSIINDTIGKTSFDTFYDKSKSLIEKGYIAIISDADESIEYDIRTRNEEKELLPLTEAEEIVYKRLFAILPEKTDISIDTSFYETFDEVSTSLEHGLKEKVNDTTSSKIKLTTFIWAIIAIALSIISYFIIPDLSPKLSFLYMFSFICACFSMFFAIIMGRKTPYGEKITAQVLGFKEFLEKVEKPQLEQMGESNPNYFYEILPYAYVLNVSKKWIEKFENIPVPENYMGNFEYSDIDSFDRIYDSVYYPSSSSSGEGGCSSCGGGCSSCGGGCSSCGGGGSW